MIQIDPTTVLLAQKAATFFREMAADIKEIRLTMVFCFSVLFAGQMSIIWMLLVIKKRTEERR